MSGSSVAPGVFAAAGRGAPPGPTEVSKIAMCMLWTCGRLSPPPLGSLRSEHIAHNSLHER